MRQLEFVGVDTNDNVIECELIDTGERLALPLDDRLRSALQDSSDAHRQRVPVTGSLRPKEIQERIRFGATPDEVAAEAGVPVNKIDGFAYPVMLERQSAADRARSAHPVLPDGPGLTTLEKMIAEAVSRRGVEPDSVRWDAWRSRDEGWIVRTTWPMGLSDNITATWSYVPDSHGGSARPLDMEAEAIVDPSNAALRAVPSAQPVDNSPPARPHSTEQTVTPTAGDARGRRDPVPAPFMVAQPPIEDARHSSGQPYDQLASAEDSTPPSPTSASDVPAGDHPGTTAAAERKNTRRHPEMPSWEEVLLGVRGKDR